jgi:hypothetical protein
MKLPRNIVAATFFAFSAKDLIAQVPQLTDQDLYRLGQSAYSRGHCVKASKYLYAFILRNPPELQADPQLRSFLESIVSDCEENCGKFAATVNVTFRRALPVCTIYTRIAVAQHETAKLAGCGFSGPRWLSNPRYHYNWCMDAKDSDVMEERRQRDSALENCAPVK